MKRFITLLITAAILGTSAMAEEFATSVAEEFDTVTEQVAPDAQDTTSIITDDSEAQYATFFDLYQAWCASANGGCAYPDYVGGVWTETGDMSVLKVALTKDDAGIAGKEEILSLIADDSSVSFTYCAYSARQLWEIQEEIICMMGGDSPIVGCGIDEMNNTVSVGVLHDHADAESIAIKLLEHYLDKIVIEYTDGFVLDCTTAGITDPGLGEKYDIGGTLTTGIETGSEFEAHTLMKPSTISPWIWIAAAAVCAAIIAVAAVFLVRRRNMLQTNAGTISEDGISKKEVESLITSTPPQPDNDLQNRIKDKLNNNTSE